MKKIIAALLAGIVTVSAVCAAAAAEKPYIRGDANGDNMIDINDATLIQRVIAQVEPDPTGEIAKRGKTTDEALSIKDATNIQKYIAKYDNEYGIGEEVTAAAQSTTAAVYPTDEYELPFIPAY